MKRLAKNRRPICSVCFEIKSFPKTCCAALGAGVVSPDLVFKKTFKAVVVSGQLSSFTGRDYACIGRRICSFLFAAVIIVFAVVGFCHFIFWLLCCGAFVTKGTVCNWYASIFVSKVETTIVATPTWAGRRMSACQNRKK